MQSNSNFQAISLIVVEDDTNLREALVDALGLQGYYVKAFESAEDLSDFSVLSEVDVVMLDINLPGESGLCLAQRIRQNWAHIGIIMLSARKQSLERTEGFRSGADIYLTKPASTEEIHRAIHSLVRRIKYSSDPKNPNYLVLRVTELILQHSGQSVALTRNEAELLAAFSRVAENTLENWQIAELLQYDLDHLEKSVIELQISRLRKKFEHLGMTGQVLRAIRNVGYQLCEEVKLER